MNTKEAIKQPLKPRGRPLAFDQDAALDAALNVFWTRGYEGASMTELTEALGINKPSIYATFGNKEALFRKALARYLAGPAAFVTEVLNEPTAKGMTEKFLIGTVEFLTNENNPRGCMIVQGALTCGAGAALIQQELVGYRKNYEDKLAERFERAKSSGELPENTNCSALAKYLATIHQGLSVQASSGASKDELMAVVALILKKWPANIG
ncbi:MAG TPA: TetR/AcrR family transcriptional regulator [Methylotenera sp.]|nr:TetR/AcrR family transcriptional regulator [Methylotenera sp.]